MNLTDRTCLLAHTELLAGIERTLLERLAGRAVVRHYDPGQIVFNQGDPGGSLVVVASGLVKLVSTSEAGDQMVVGVAGAGSVFGEITLIDGGARTAAAAVMVPTTALMLARDALFGVLRTEPRLVEALLVRLVQRLRATHETAADMMFLDLAGRVAKLLVDLSRYGEGDAVIDLERLHLTQRDLGGMVGGSRQSANQILRSFQARGWIQLKRRTIVVLDGDRLRHRARMSGQRAGLVEHAWGELDRPKRRGH